MLETIITITGCIAIAAAAVAVVTCFAGSAFDFYSKSFEFSPCKDDAKKDAKKYFKISFACLVYVVLWVILLYILIYYNEL